MSLQREIDRLSTELVNLGASLIAEAPDAGPAAIMEASGLEPDPWQRRILETEHKRTLLLVTRQGGKSTTTAAKALYTAMYKPGSLVLLLSPSLRQSQELFLKTTTLYQQAGEVVALDSLSALRMQFVHGSRIIALPGTEKTVRGYSGVDLLVIDEASRVLDELYYSVRPMLAVSGGELIALSTPWGKRGWFYEEYEKGGDDWQRVRVTANECPRISEAFLEEERRRMPEAWFRSEYLCEFTDALDSVFRSEDIERAFSADVKPLFATDDQAESPDTISGIGVEPLFA